MAGFSDMVKLLLKEGASVNRSDTAGRTPLHFIFQQNSAREEVVASLVKAGAEIPDPYKKDILNYYIPKVLTKVGVFKDVHKIIMDYANEKSEEDLTQYFMPGF